MTSRALQSLLTGLIDYAGLFPPAGLGMDAAVRNYDSYVDGEYAWMLGRFIVPAARLAEYAEAVRIAGIDASAWRLSVLATQADAESSRDSTLGRRTGAGGLADRRAGDQGGERARDPGCSAGVRRELSALFRDAAGEVAVLAAGDGGCEGQSEDPDRRRGTDAIPEESRVLEFLRIASERRLAFKATAGLHHPLRAMQRLTYKPDSPQAVMHGFLNVFCAAALLWHEPGQRQEAAWMLGERDADAITMDEAMTWHNSGVTLTAEQIHEAREQFCIGFGSCSFTEPIDDLRKLGWL